MATEDEDLTATLNEARRRIESAGAVLAGDRQSDPEAIYSVFRMPSPVDLALTPEAFQGTDIASKFGKAPAKPITYEDVIKAAHDFERDRMHGRNFASPAMAGRSPLQEVSSKIPTLPSEGPSLGEVIREPGKLGAEALHALPRGAKRVLEGMEQAESGQMGHQIHPQDYLPPLGILYGGRLAGMMVEKDAPGMLGAVGGRLEPKKITALVDALRGDPQFQLRSHQIYNDLAKQFGETIPEASGRAQSLAWRDEGDSIRKMVRGTAEPLMAIAERQAAEEIYAARFGEGEFELGSAGGRGRSIGKIRNEVRVPDVKQIAQRLGLDIKETVSPHRGSTYLRLTNPKTGKSMEVRSPSPDDRHKGKTERWRVDLYSGQPNKGAVHASRNLAGEAYEYNDKALEEHIARTLGVERPARVPHRSEKSTAPPPVRPDPRQMDLFALQRPEVQKVMMDSHRIGESYGMIANQLRRHWGIDTTADAVRAVINQLKASRMAAPGLALSIEEAYRNSPAARVNADQVMQMEM